MPAVTKVQAQKQALPGPMRIVPEGTLGAWPGDNMNDCAQMYSCGSPTLTLDPFVPFGNRFVDVGAGGPAPFAFSVTSNVSWLKIEPSSGSVSPSSPETRVFLSVDWSKVSGVEFANVNFVANATGQPSSAQNAFFVANKTVVPEGFKGRSCGYLAVTSCSRVSQALSRATAASPSRPRTPRATPPWRASPGLSFQATAARCLASRHGRAAATS